MEFPPRSRRIFRYFDGRKRRGIDPLEADIALQAVDLDWEAKFTLAKIGDAEAIQEILAAARKIFSLPKFDIDDDTESGLTSEEVIGVLAAFGEWRTSLADFTEPPPTTPASTEAASPAATASGTDSTLISPDNSLAKA